MTRATARHVVVNPAAAPDLGAPSGRRSPNGDGGRGGAGAARASADRGTSAPAARAELLQDSATAEPAAPVGDAATVWPPGFSMRPGGLFWQPPGEDKPEQWLAGPFAVEGEVRAVHGRGWGLLLSWRDRDGRRHRHALAHRALVGEAATAEGELADRGLSISPAPGLRGRLRTALVLLRSPVRVTSVPRAE